MGRPGLCFVEWETTTLRAVVLAFRMRYIFGVEPFVSCVVLTTTAFTPIGSVRLTKITKECGEEISLVLVLMFSHRQCIITGIFRLEYNNGFLPDM